MMARRIIGLIVVFALGIAVGMQILRATASSGVVSASEAQRRAIQMLARTPVSDGIGDNKIVRAVQRIEPAVVNIDTVGRVFNDADTGSPYVVDQEVRGKGSGVILTPDGYIITNNHVIEGANRIRVTMPDGRGFFAHLVGRDPQTDLAVVRIEASGLPIADLGDSEKLQVGEWCIAVGNPLGLGSTITVGVVSALNRRNLNLDESHTLDGAIQTDAAINRGNSGGALANINGQLIGINTAILSSGPNGGNIGLGFALPINTVRRVARDIIESGKTLARAAGTPWLGVEFGPVPALVRQNLGLAPYHGVMVAHAVSDGPASQAGIADGDIILAIDGKAIGAMKEVHEAVMQHRVGEQCLLHILRLDRSGLRREREVRVTLQERTDASLPVRP